MPKDSKGFSKMVGLLGGIIILVGAPFLSVKYVKDDIREESDLLYVSQAEFRGQTAEQIIQTYNNNATHVKAELKSEKNYWETRLKFAALELERLDMLAEYGDLTELQESERIFARENVIFCKKNLEAAMSAMSKNMVGN